MFKIDLNITLLIYICNFTHIYERFMKKFTLSDDFFKGCRKLTTETGKWLMENYHIMTTEECAQHLKLSKKTIINYAFRLNLRKSPEHISRMRRMQALNTNKKRWKK